MAANEPIDTGDKYDRPRWNHRRPAIQIGKHYGCMDALAMGVIEADAAKLCTGALAMDVIEVDAARLMRLKVAIGSCSFGIGGT